MTTEEFCSWYETRIHRAGGIVKTNKDGRECPDWCAIDHQASQDNIACSSPPVDRWQDGYVSAIDGKAFCVYTSQSPRCDHPEIAVRTYSNAGTGVVLADSKASAGKLASFLDGASAFSSEHIRAMAAEVRQKAAELYPEPEARS